MSKKLPSRHSRVKKTQKVNKKSLCYQKRLTPKQPDFSINVWGLKSESNSNSSSKEHYKQLVTLLIFILLIVALVSWLLPDMTIGGVVTTGLFKLIRTFKNRSP